MQIVCPNCTTSYEIAPMAIGGSGRSVRCVRCQSVWFVAAPELVEVPPSASRVPDNEAAVAFRA